MAASKANWRRYVVAQLPNMPPGPMTMGFMRLPSMARSPGVMYLVSLPFSAVARAAAGGVLAKTRPAELVSGQQASVLSRTPVGMATDCVSTRRMEPLFGARGLSVGLSR